VNEISTSASSEARFISGYGRKRAEKKEEAHIP
jgi:hypothetical protein